MTTRQPIQYQPEGVDPSRHRRYVGYLDVVWRSGEICGWAMDLDDPRHIVEVHLYLNNSWLGMAYANEYRKDVFEAGFGNGYSGFWFRNFTIDILQGRVQPGDRVRAFLDNDPRHELPNSPLTIEADKLDQVRSVVEFSENFQDKDDGIRFRMYSLCGNDNVVKKMVDEGLQSYEPPLPAILYYLLKSFDGMFLDIGANSGIYSLLAASLGHSRTIAFEPFPLIHALLRCNIDLNGYGDKIHAEKTAISRSSGKLKLYIPQNIGAIETSASLESTFKIKHAEVIEVDALSLDDYLENQGLASQPIAVIKIDVEGHEPAVLEGSRNTVTRHRPIIVIEILASSKLEYFGQFKSTQDYTEVVFSGGKILTPLEVRFFPKQYNHLFVPNEVFSDKFIPLMESIGWCE